MGCGAGKVRPSQEDEADDTETERVSKKERRYSRRKSDTEEYPARGNNRSNRRRQETYEEDFDDKNDKILMEEPIRPVIPNTVSIPPQMPDMKKFQNYKCAFMIKPFDYKKSNRSDPPEPRNSSYNDVWDDDHVKMPCSAKYIEKQEMWPTIQSSLQQLRTICQSQKATFQNLEDTITFGMRRSIDMRHLHDLIEEEFADDEREIFMNRTLPGICQLALQVKEICGEAPPLLKSGSNNAVTLSQRQAASLLACAFFCLYPYRSSSRVNDSSKNYPDPNFHELYGGESNSKREKLRCLLNYFRRVISKTPSGVITFRRIFLREKSFPDWKKSRMPLVDLYFDELRHIEEIEKTLHVDSANKYIGGSVLKNGCFPEEIRFSVCPEMIVGLIICEKLVDDECMMMIGCEQYSMYQNVGDLFRFNGNFVDKTPKDNWGRRWLHVVAMDSLEYREPETQYQMRFIDRELRKAFACFYTREDNDTNSQYPIATGHWGVGLSNSDRELKSMIQLLSASELGRSLIFCFPGQVFKRSFLKAYKSLKVQGATVGDLYKYLIKFSQARRDVTLFRMMSDISVAAIRSS